MKITQPVTNYIPKSLLTTKGDLLVQGTSAAQRLAAGINGYSLLAQGASQLPIWEGADIKYAWGTSLRFRDYIWEIGDWNMDTTAFVTWAHGLTLAKIVDMHAVIRADSLDWNLPLDYYDGTNPGGYIQCDGTNVSLFRVAGGIFDNNGFDDTPLNRGWAILKVLI